MATAVDSAVLARVIELTGAFLVLATWQVTLLGAGAAAVLAVTGGADPRHRYAFAITTLVAMPLWPALSLLGAAPDAFSWTTPDRPVRMAAQAAHVLTPWLPLIVGIWLSGVVFFVGRLALGWHMLQRLVFDGAVVEIPHHWQVRAQELAARMGLTRRFRLASVATIDGPCVVGWMRPVILMPLGVLGGLGPTQLEAILAHELAHIRRHDALVNLLQVGIEAVLYFHPAMWWVSKQVRVEREHCCDDLALTVCGNRLDYADALSALERWRGQRWHPSLAASDGDLLTRIRRVVEGRAHSRSEVRASLVVAGLGVIGAIAAASIAGAVSATGAVVDRTSWPGADIFTPLTGALLGLAVGIRHAFEPDHLVAVTTMVVGNRSRTAAVRLGAAWGLGHAVSLGVACVSLMLLQSRMPSQLSRAFELAVAVVLLALGVRALQAGARAMRHGPRVEHTHGARRHAHAGAAAHVHVGNWTLARRPFLVGIVHGLAGSGSLMALAAAELSSVAAQGIFIALFAAGSTVAMAALSTAAGWPTRLVLSPRLAAALSVVAGLASATTGVVWGLGL